jgi:hypothetical protein
MDIVGSIKEAYSPSQGLLSLLSIILCINPDQLPCQFISRLYVKLTLEYIIVIGLVCIYHCSKVATKSSQESGHSSLLIGLRLIRAEFDHT